MVDEGEKKGVNLGYALGQLARVLTSSGDRAVQRVGEWQRVLAGMLDGSLAVGSRTPVQGAPAWVTLDVVHGGFATGGFAAGGALRPHELSKLGEVERGAAVSERAALNAHYLGDVGRAELGELLQSGRYRIVVPEEAALLANAWLLRRGEVEPAAALLEALTPFFDRLRFYPMPHARPLRVSSGVSFESAGETRARLAKRQPQADVARMKEAIEVWAPLYDRAVALFLETVEGESPRLNQVVDRVPVVEGGWPCRHFPTDFGVRAAAVLTDYERLRARHRLCGKPEKPKENFARLRRLLSVAADDPVKLTGRDVGEVRRVLASFVTAHGAPGSATHAALRQAQSREAARPLHHRVAGTLAQRLEACPEDEGVADFEPIVAVLSATEAAQAGCAVGAAVPRELVTRVNRCLEAPLGQLIERRVVTSSEAMARLLPPLTAAAGASSIPDPELRGLYASSYSAFHKRRSLLLLNLESQAKLGELPSIRAIQPWMGGDAESAAAARAVLRDAGTLTIAAFPQTIVPNKLVKELRSLAMTAGTPLPFVEELAADIFMGAFSETYLKAAQLAARLLKGTLYERYYGLSYARVAQLDDVIKQQYGASISPGLATICQELAAKGDKPGSFAAANGTVIEQAQILTTHNLATLFAGTDVGEVLRPRLAELSRTCFRWVCRRQQITRTAWQVRLRMQKNTAYAWRQLVFYLSLSARSEQDEFLAWGDAHLAEQSSDFRDRFAPVLGGLRLAVARESFDADGRHASGARRFLGWSIGRHWLMPRE